MSRQAGDPQSVRFDIGHITLDGYSAHDRDRFERALRTHLTELAAAQQGAWPASGTWSIRRLNTTTIPAGASPERAARLIAARVVGAVCGSRGSASTRQVTRPSGTLDAPGSAGPSATAGSGGVPHV